MLNTTPFTTAPKKRKYLGICLTKHIKELYPENHNIQIKQIKENLNKWRYTLCSWIRRCRIVKMSILPKVKILINIPVWFYRHSQIYSRIYMGVTKSWTRLGDWTEMNWMGPRIAKLSERSWGNACKMKYPFLFGHARGMLDLLRPGNEPTPLPVEVWSLNNWTTQEVPEISLKMNLKSNSSRSGEIRQELGKRYTVPRRSRIYKAHWLKKTFRKGVFEKLGQG